MKTSDLIGAPLNYWVAMAGEEWNHFDTSDTMTLDPSYKGVRLVTYGDGTQDAILVPSNPMRQGARVFQPSTDWAQGGPIIDRERIQLKGDHNQWRSPSWLWTAWPDVVGAGVKANGRSDASPLIAAMRAFVASVYGDNVPDEVSA
ncbi:MAG: phage protein NinX family protein [Telluria sp.]